MPTADRPAWHRLTEQESATQLDVNADTGLAGVEAARRLNQVGPNVLVEQGRRSILGILWEQLRAALILLLIVAAVVSAAVGDFEDALAILAIVVLNAALGVRQ